MMTPVEAVKWLEHVGLPVASPMKQKQILKNIQVFWKSHGNFSVKYRQVEACLQHPILGKLDIDVITVQLLKVLNFAFRQVIRDNDPQKFDPSRDPKQMKEKIQAWANKLMMVYHEFLTPIQHLVKAEQFIEN